MKSILVFIVWLITLLPSNKAAKDYRDTFCGNYSCKRIYKYSNSNYTGMVSDTSNVTLVISKNDKDSLLNINTPEGSFVFTLKDNNVSSTNKNIRCFGKIRNDSLYLTCIPSSGPESFRYIGKK